MAVDRINVWEDHRVQKRSAHLNGRTYGIACTLSSLAVHATLSPSPSVARRPAGGYCIWGPLLRTMLLVGYLYGEPPQGTYRGTIFLVHGFPDLSMGWRYQIPMLLSLGLRVVAPDCMGYGRTDAPPYKLHDYGYRRVSDDLAELARQLGEERIILGGHDWGGAIVYRVALYHPHLVTSLFSVCTPYFPPNPTYRPLKLLTSTSLPMLTYQLQFASGAVEEAIQSPAEIKSLLNAFYGGRDLSGSKPAAGPAFNPEKGVRLDSGLHKMSATPLLSTEELEYYAAEYSRHGIHAPLNWYRTRELNWEEEYSHFFEMGKMTQPPVLAQDVLFVLATKDTALRPELAKRMVSTEGDDQGAAGAVLPRLRRREVMAGHWALWEKPEEVNRHVREWLEEVVFPRGAQDGSDVGSKL